METDRPLKLHERLLTGMDIGSLDGDSIVWMVYDGRVEIATIIDCEYAPPQGVKHGD